MWYWSHPGWLLPILPLLMMLVCLLMCVFGASMCGPSGVAYSLRR